MIKELTKHLKIMFVLLAISILALVVVVFYQSSTPDTATAGLKNSVYIKLKPGKATEKDVLSLLGKPTSTTKKDDKTYYIYSTKSVNLNNSVVFKNNVVYYSLENFFGDYSKKPLDYQNAYGKPDLVLRDKNDDTLEWRIFLTKGVAVVVFPFENTIVKLFYFSPQTKDVFETELGQEMGLVKEIEIHAEEVF